MIKKIAISFIFSILFSGLSVFAYTETYTTSDYGEENWAKNESSYSVQNKGIWNKLKSAFIGQPTGYTPQVPPSPYLNKYYGPSYQQGFYTGDRWNDHNVYYPQYPIKVYGKSF